MEYENIILKPELLISGKNDLCAVRWIFPFMNGEIPSETFLTPELPYYKDVSGCIRQIDLLCSAQTEGYQLAVKGLLFQFFFLLVSNRQKKETAEHRDRIYRLPQRLPAHHGRPAAEDVRQPGTGDRGAVRV